MYVAHLGSCSFELQEYQFVADTLVSVLSHARCHERRVSDGDLPSPACMLAFTRAFCLVPPLSPLAASLVLRSGRCGRLRPRQLSIQIGPIMPPKKETKKRAREETPDSSSEREEEEEKATSSKAKAKKTGSKKKAKVSPPLNNQPTNLVLPVDIKFPSKIANTTRITTWNICGLVPSQKKVSCSTEDYSSYEICHALCVDLCCRDFSTT